MTPGQTDVGRTPLLERSAHLFQEHQRKIIHQTSHLFAYLMIVQWVGGVVAALGLALPVRFISMYGQLSF